MAVKEKKALSEWQRGSHIDSLPVEAPVSPIRHAPIEHPSAKTEERRSAVAEFLRKQEGK